MPKQITDQKRINWLLDNPGFSCTEHEGVFCIAAWVCNGGPGNENGGGSRFYTKGKTRIECVDSFLLGKIQGPI